MHIDKLVNRFLNYKSIFEIYQKDLDTLNAEKANLYKESKDPSFFLEELIIIQKKISNYEEKYSAVLDALLYAEEKIEELKVFEQELNENEKSILLKEINQKLEVLETFKIRKEKGYSLGERAQYCNYNYTEIDNFFKKNFGIPLPESMKTKEELITKGRSRIQIKKCKDFVKCKKDKICPKKIDLFDFLLTVDSFKFGDFFTLSKVDQFLNLDTNNYYGIGCFGYGINTNGFFYLRIDNWRKYYFRFHTGGVYTSFKRDKMGTFIKCFVAFENNIKDKVDNIQVVWNLNSLNIKITHKGNEINKSFYNILITDRIPKIFNELELELLK